MGDRFHAERLRPLAHVTDPDPRTKAFVRFNPETGEDRPLEIGDYHAAVASLELHENVPEKVAVQFETARNLYLYAWFVYRFFPVAEHHTLVCLEYALRERYGNEIPENYVRKGRTPTFGPLLRYAVDKGDIRNDGFTVWEHRAEIRSRERQFLEAIREMNERGLTEMTIDEGAAEIKEEDRDWDYVRVLIDTLPAIRNNYAHGSSMLHNTVLGRLRTVSECINQLY